MRAKPIHSHPIAGMILAFFLVFPSTAWARRYQPPSGDPPTGSFGSNGSRGCDLTVEHSQPVQPSDLRGLQPSLRPAAPDQPKPLPITLLAPLQHVGRTSSVTPTFAWFVSAPHPYRVQISLFTDASDQSSKLLHQLEYVETTSGLIQYTLPEDKSALQTGQRYFVQLSMACNPSSDRFNQSFIAEIDVKAPSPALKQALSQARTSQQKAAVFAKAGYWFDTVRELFVDASPSDAYHQLPDLLKELALLEVEAEHRQALVKIADLLKDSTQRAPVKSLNSNPPFPKPLN
ncbi:DUF928 domain-containing protein [Acaryochloris sp. IP29b_bin.148]|uniref:DUF928 domain-containing protein n=1 Tax=Acaryochloris sp. IP29b_bin.148 TaxID=2969218 RepID=UPI002610C3EA|nr:DUF928 domain-containing protein [Acaryochloris sp. IP29b_bin.148]